MKKIIANIEKLNSMQTSYKTIQKEMAQLSNQWCDARNAFKNKYGEIMLSEITDKMLEEWHSLSDINSQILKKAAERDAVEKKFIKGVSELAENMGTEKPDGTLYGSSLSLFYIFINVKGTLKNMGSTLEFSFEKLDSVYN